jgi:tRNA A37 threonylcarbamoyladenosine dehydratase
LPKPFPILVAHLLSNIKKNVKVKIRKKKKKNQGYINCVFSLNYIKNKRKEGE